MMDASRSLPLLNFARGDPAEATPALIALAGIRAIESGQTHYSDPRGTAALRAAIAQTLQVELSVSYRPDDEILATAGAAPALFTTIMALTAPGDAVLLPDPGWPPYTQMVASLRRRPITYPMPWVESDLLPGAWSERLSALITPETRLIVLNSPHNPTGALLDAPWLASLAAVCDAHPQLIVLSDEVYSQIVFDDRVFCSPAALPHLTSRTVVVRSFSKAYRMPGWRVGYLAARAPLAGPIVRLHLAMNAFASSMSQAAALWALEHGADLARDFCRRCQEARDFLAAALNRLPDFRCATPQGTFYLFPNIAASGMRSERFAAQLAELGISVYPGALYGRAGEGHIRLCFAVERLTLEALVERLCHD